MLPRAEVLLATYNGGEFLREQINSILGQHYRNLTVLARDDGSADDTAGILQEYAQRFPGRFRLMPAPARNGGILNNFLTLLRASTADYVCFSDQDDVWLPDKVSRTQNKMSELESECGNQIPILVFTDLRVVDENLSTLCPSYWQRMEIDPLWSGDLTRLLANSVVTGCTAMANRRLVELALRMPKEACLHDRWMGLLAAALGKAAFIREQTVLYRQHGRNAIGVGPTEGPKSLPQRIRQSPGYARLYVAGWRSNQEQAAAFLKVHGAELPEQQRKVLEAFRRCETSRSRLVRIATFLRQGFSSRGRLSRLAVILHLWSLHSQAE